ncbi:formylglycine-generating enzyme family protein [Flavobacterium sp. UBA6195]|uniref:formylglycine-generating enzyme family protein n=1 Tax=Flavobacterium sp. UBA6195 TaxID=1946554 RepID=UPI0025BFDF95|nr:SUMF1/EgtB/PvdO family nonheme iron enzyme [Flavobacterium sp. UBA6195]
MTNSDFVLIEGGTFKMGSKSTDKVADVDEQKEHVVKLNSFMISKFEVTVWEWKEFIKANKMKMPEKPQWGWQENHPINGVTWNEAIAYCNWLSKREKLQPLTQKKDLISYAILKRMDIEFQLRLNGNMLLEEVL